MSQRALPVEYRELLTRIDELSSDVRAMRAALVSLIDEVSHPLPKWIMPITKDDEWFWSEEWQKKEKEADEAESRGDFVEFDNPKDAIAYLQS